MSNKSGVAVAANILNRALLTTFDLCLLDSARQKYYKNKSCNNAGGTMTIARLSKKFEANVSNNLFKT